MASSLLKPDAKALAQCIDRALSLWPDRQTWRQLMTTGMKADWSWQRSAREYVAVYEEIKHRVRRETSLRIRPTPQPARLQGREPFKFRP